MQFTGCHQPVQRSYWPENAMTGGRHNGNEMRNEICVGTQTLIGGPTVIAYTVVIYCIKENSHYNV